MTYECDLDVINDNVKAADELWMRLMLRGCTHQNGLDEMKPLRTIIRCHEDRLDTFQMSDMCQWQMSFGWVGHLDGNGCVQDPFSMWARDWSLDVPTIWFTLGGVYGPSGWRRLARVLVVALDTSQRPSQRFRVQLQGKVQNEIFEVPVKLIPNSVLGKRILKGHLEASWSDATS